MTRDWSGFEPHSKSLGAIYADALEELLKPYPALKLAGQEHFNTLVGGFRAREFTILCGSTGTGKTTLLANWQRALLESQVRTFVMSVETGATDFVKRTMSVFLGRDVNTGDAVPVEALQSFHQRFGHHFQTERAYLALYDNRIKLENVVSEILYHHEVKGCQVVFIDNLNFLMEVVSQSQAVAEMDRVVHELIMLCKRTDVHIVMVMHPRKTDGGRVESEFDIKGSSTAVQEAHNVFLFNRPRPDDEKYSSFHRELTLQKLRRRGQHTRKRILYACQGTQYTEVAVEWPTNTSTA
jgi:KaiC/GvpD/RAD55 family RecA-like ATPase